MEAKFSKSIQNKEKSLQIMSPSTSSSPPVPFQLPHDWVVEKRSRSTSERVDTNVAIELVVECEAVPGSRCESVFLANESNPLPFSVPNVERLKSGLEDYVARHENNVHQKCDSCFPTMAHLKVGSGALCSKESKRNSGHILEVVVIISELESTSPCSRTCCF